MNLHDFTPGTPALRPMNRQALTDDQLRRICPAIFANAPHGEVSDRYAFIPTSEIVAGLRANGWEPVKAMDNTVRLHGKQGFQKHMIRFAPMGAMRAFRNVGDVLPELVMVNSHDRTSTFTFHAGLFRLACNNGLIVCDAQLSAVAARHVGGSFKAETILEAAFEVVKDMDAVPERVESMKQITLTREEQDIFAQAAHTLRWEDRGAAPVMPVALLTPRRIADGSGYVAKPDLFTTLNVVQENMIRGGVRGRNATGQRNRVRAINSVTEDVRLNRALWKLADAMKGHKAAQVA